MAKSSEWESVVKRSGRQVLVILAPHRSGSSALTRVLNLAGARLPRHLVNPLDGKPGDANRQKGFWESAPLLVINDRILSAAGVGWASPEGPSEAWFESEEANDRIPSLAEGIAAEVDAESPTVVKDPRICLLLPLWQRAFELLGIEPLWVLLVRNPLESARSLEDRDGLALSHGLRLWTLYLGRAERGTRGHERCVVTFPSLLENWSDVVSLVSTRFQLELQGADVGWEEEAERFLDPSLHHHQHSIDDVETSADCGPTLRALFAWACRAAEADRLGQPYQHFPELPTDTVARVGSSPALQLHPDPRALALQLALRNRWIARVACRSGRNQDALRSLGSSLREGVAAHRGALERVDDLLVDDGDERLSGGTSFAVPEGLRSRRGLRVFLEHEASAQQRLLELLEGVVDLLGDDGTQLTSERGQALGVPERDGTTLVAFYLPQYHPIPENDEWWGPDFTEWDNVKSARPLFDGHPQPALPGELGYYDLRSPAVRAQQARLAADHGIGAFCYYYYWFNGRRVLERPLDEVILRGQPDFPFCICWANENWTRRWDGGDDEILLAQSHSRERDKAFIEDVLPTLLDPRYVRVGGRPVVLVYRPDLLVDPIAVTGFWRLAARLAGLPDLHLCAVDWRVAEPLSIGFDALVEFPPHNLDTTPAEAPPGLDPQFHGRILDYRAAVERLGPRAEAPFPVYRSVMPGWDNTPRQGLGATVWVGSSPRLYKDWLVKVLQEARERTAVGEQLVFINAWNEWGEGAVLEPSNLLGRANLTATREAVEEVFQETT